jgi:HEAT repeat protein
LTEPCDESRTSDAMISRYLFIGASVALIAVGSAGVSVAQPTSETKDLGAGWTALAAGRSAEAERFADAILRTDRRSHDALALKIAARIAAGNVGGSLDVYEQWLSDVRQREDVFLLERVAIGVVDLAAKSKERTVRTRALEIQAALGNRQAMAQLSALADAPATVRADASLARQGDAAAIARLTAKVKDPAARDVSDAIDALREADAKSAVGPIAAALDPRRPLPTKMAAARALGHLGALEAIPRLREALNDPDPPVRAIAAVSLAALGDHSGDEIIQSLERSPVGDFRLLAVEARAAREPTGAWIGVASSVLDDPDPLVRLRAAELLVRHAAEPGRASDVLQEALADTNPAMRQTAADRLASLPAAALDRNLPVLRKLLRDSFAPSRLEAAAALLRASGAITP